MAAMGDPAPQSEGRMISFVSPRHPDGSDWPWLSRIGPMRKHRFQATYVENTFKPFPKATRAHVRWQYVKAMRRIARSDLAFLFSTDINVGMTSWPSKWLSPPKRVYVGFTQDGPWGRAKVDRLAAAMAQLDAVTVISETERRIYLDRYSLHPDRAVVSLLHTDEAEGYERYDAPRPLAEPYVVSIGLPNRRFFPIARICRDLKIPLVIITRPTFKSESLDEIASMGARIVTDADKTKSFTYLKHARFPVFAFQQPDLPGAITTVLHANFFGHGAVSSLSLGLDEYIVHGETGFVTPHGDDDALRESIDHLWNDPGRAEQFGRAALERARRLFSLEAAADRYAALIDRLLPPRRAT